MIVSFCIAVEVQEEGMSGIQFFFTIVFSVLGLGVLAVVGLMIYARWKENRHKRFYWSENILRLFSFSEPYSQINSMNNLMGLKPRAKKHNS